MKRVWGEFRWFIGKYTYSINIVCYFLQFAIHSVKRYNFNEEVTLW